MTINYFYGFFSFPDEREEYKDEEEDKLRSDESNHWKSISRFRGMIARVKMPCCVLKQKIRFGDE